MREKRPPPTSRDWKQAWGGAAYLSAFRDLRQVGHPHWSPTPAPPEGGLPQCQEAVGCREAGLGRGACSGVKWFSVAVLGSTRPWLP